MEPDTPTFGLSRAGRKQTCDAALSTGWVAHVPAGNTRFCDSGLQVQRRGSGAHGRPVPGTMLADLRSMRRPGNGAKPFLEGTESNTMQSRMKHHP